MNFNLKQWRFQDDDDDDSAVPAKLPRLFFDSSQIKQEEELDIIINNNTNSNNKTEYSVSPQLHLFVPTDGEDSNIINNSNSNEQQHPSDQSTTRLPKMGGGGSYFSYGQWQELELQALIYRHMLAGAAIPPQLLQMVHKSLFNGVSLPASNSLTSPYFVHPLQHYSQYHPALMQSGYWGRGAMDPEPGRCRRTDGKKWRCSREVVGGQKYCERHVHRGRNRSRKPVELHPDTTTTLVGGTTSNAASAQAAQAGRTTHFDLSGTSSSLDGFHHAQRHTGSQAENNFTSETENMNGELKYGGQPLRRFFDDWTNRSSDSSASSTSPSISTPGNVTSDFSLKLATGNGSESVERETLQSGWGGAGWTQANRVVPIGGPLAEALRGSEVSPTSVLNLVK